MEQIGDLVNIRLNQHNIGESARASEIVHKANQYLSKWLKCEFEDVRAYQVKDGILWISVGNPVWSQEAWGVGNKLLKKIQNEYGDKIVKRIRTKSLTIK